MRLHGPVLALALALSAALSAGAEGTRGLSVVRAPTGETLRGDNWLLLIAIGRYREWGNLRGPGKDVDALKEVLLDRYTFDADHMIELRDDKATKEGIIKAFKSLGRKLRPDDNLFVYYAGHGHTDEDSGTGYWIPHDAGADTTAQGRWLPNAAVRGYLRSMKCSHVLLVSDSCFSGDLLDEQRGQLPQITDAYFRRAYQMQARQVLTSGGSEPVSDAGLGGQSAFAFHLVRTLERNRKPYLDPLQLFVHIRAGVKGQMPLLGALKGAGHQEGGAYIFFLREGGAARTARTPTPPSGGLDLSDLTQQSEARKQWDAWLARMKADYREGEQFASGSSDAALNVKAWQRFVDTYTQDDPFSTEDESLRSSAGRELAGWRVKAKRPLQTAAPAGKTLTLDLGGGASMELVLVPAGEFMMGDGKTSHRVRITQPFYMGKYEVTQAQYERIMGKNPSKWKGSDLPVEQVSWNDATEFCRKLLQKTGSEVRLPTEAEWEYACRAGSTTRFCFGDSDNGLGDYAWYSGNTGRKTHPVGGKRANAWGLHDVHGNVSEWCADWYGKYPSGAVSDPTGPASGGFRVVRGGSWFNGGPLCRSAFRLTLRAPNLANCFFGFRVVVPVTAED